MTDPVRPKDPRLGRFVQFDERSRKFAAVKGLKDVRPFRSYTWRVGPDHTALDQGSEGACVGFAWAHGLMARPVEVKGVDASVAMSIYGRAKELDPWPGDDYDGTSVLAGAKACKERGYISEYRWAFGLDEVRLALGYLGPVVLGLNWYAGMVEPLFDGRIRPTGDLYGGHCILAYANSERLKRAYLWNSWGEDWGRPSGGSCWLSYDDLGRLLSEQGEACIPAGRVLP